MRFLQLKKSESILSQNTVSFGGYSACWRTQELRAVTFGHTLLFTPMWWQLRFHQGRPQRGPVPLRAEGDVGAALLCRPLRSGRADVRGELASGRGLASLHMPDQPTSRWVETRSQESFMSHARTCGRLPSRSTSVSTRTHRESDANTKPAQGCQGVKP